MKPDILWAASPSTRIAPVSTLPQSTIRLLESHRSINDDTLVVAHAPGTRSRPVLLNESSLRLLRQFDVPSTVMAAVVRFGSDEPPELMSSAGDILEALRGLIRSGLIVQAEDPNWLAALAPALGEGDTYEAYEVLGVVHYTGDTEVYEARHRELGSRHALKRLSTQSEPVVQMFAREKRALLALEGTAACRCDEVIGPEGEALILEWIPGIPLPLAVAELHASGASRRTLLELAMACVDAVASIHAEGYLHGDIHPGNFLVEDGGRVRLVDFGLACRVTKLGTQISPTGGVLAFMAPEQARATVEGRTTFRRLIATELYSLAAVLFFVFTGDTPLELSVGWEDALAEVSTAPIRSFRSTGVRSWPAAEAMLDMALRKDPAQRFDSAGDLRAALARLRRSSSGLSHDQCGLRHELATYVENCVASLDRLSWAEFRETSAAPYASVAFGAAGVAYALFRASTQLEDPHLLGVSRKWVGWALAERTKKDAFTAPAFGLDRSLAPEGSPYYGLAGVYLVEALVADASGDVLGQRQALRAWLRLARTPLHKSELLAGSAGRLLGLTHLRASLGEACGDAIGRETSKEVQRTLGRTSGNGLAHGAAGGFFALLAWSRASGEPLGSLFWARLGDFAARGIERPGRMAWPVRDREQPPRYMCSWCNGTPGLVLLWLLAHEVSGEAKYLELARGCGKDVLDTAGPSHLCCGVGGRAYACLALARADHELSASWHETAMSLAAEAIRGSRLEHWPYSLFKGSSGLLCLALDLLAEQPEGFPCIELFGTGCTFKAPTTPSEGGQR